MWVRNIFRTSSDYVVEHFGAWRERRRQIKSLQVNSAAKSMARRLRGTAHQVNLATEGAVAELLAANHKGIKRQRYRMIFGFFLVVLVPLLTVPIEGNVALVRVVGIIWLLSGVSFIHKTGRYFYLYYRSDAIVCYVNLLYKLDRYRANGLTLQTQGILNQELDKLARVLAVYPRRMKVKNTRVNEVASKKAAGALELHEWVSTPMDGNTYWFLTLRLATDLSTFATIGWQALTEPKQETVDAPPRPTAAIVLWSIASVAVVGIIVLTGLNSERLGLPVTSVLLLLEISFALFVLLRAGVPLAQMKELIDLMKSVKGEVKADA